MKYAIIAIALVAFFNIVWFIRRYNNIYYGYAEEVEPGQYIFHGPPPNEIGNYSQLIFKVVRKPGNDFNDYERKEVKSIDDRSGKTYR